MQQIWSSLARSQWPSRGTGHPKRVPDPVNCETLLLKSSKDSTTQWFFTKIGYPKCHLWIDSFQCKTFSGSVNAAMLPILNQFKWCLPSWLSVDIVTSLLVWYCPSDLSTTVSVPSANVKVARPKRYGAWPVGSFSKTSRSSILTRAPTVFGKRIVFWNIQLTWKLWTTYSKMKSFPEKMHESNLYQTVFFDDLSGPVEVKTFQPPPTYHTFRRERPANGNARYCNLALATSAP